MRVKVSFISAVAFSLATLSVNLHAVQSDETAALDLTVAVPNAESLGVPGMTRGVIGGGPKPIQYPITYQLPLEIKIRALKPREEHSSDKFVIELEMRNTTDIAFSLPAQRNQAIVQADGNRNRRTFFFRVRALWNESGASQSAIATVAVVFGSEDKPDSLFHLEPDQSLRVLLAVNLNEFDGLVSSEREKVQLEVVCSEYLLEDGRYFIKSWSGETVSNRIQMRVPPREAESDPN